MSKYAPRYTLARYHDDTWADEVRKREGAVARDPWCIAYLYRAHAIRPDHHGAAVRYTRLLERGAGQGSSGRMEAIDGAGADPHARQMDAIRCAQEAECAMAYVRTQLMADESPNPGLRIAVLDCALAFPHLSVSQAQRDAGLGYGGKRERERFISLLIDGLELLALYFDATAAAAERARR